jgi:hypothetical protein
MSAIGMPCRYGGCTRLLSAFSLDEYCPKHRAEANFINDVWDQRDKLQNRADAAASSYKMEYGNTPKGKTTGFSRIEEEESND